MRFIILAIIAGFLSVNCFGMDADKGLQERVTNLHKIGKAMWTICDLSNITYRNDPKSPIINKENPKQAVEQEKERNDVMLLAIMTTIESAEPYNGSVRFDPSHCNAWAKKYGSASLKTLNNDLIAKLKSEKQKNIDLIQEIKDLDKENACLRKFLANQSQKAIYSINKQKIILNNLNRRCLGSPFLLAEYKPIFADFKTFNPARLAKKIKKSDIELSDTLD